MIDFHNHVLPNLDDGSKSMQQTLSMLKTASEQGITDIICTVHYQHPKMGEKEINFEIVNQCIENVQNEMQGININLHPGAEVFYLPNLTEIKSDLITVFGHGKYMLIEFLPYQLPINYDEELFKLSLSGTTPIIAHPERYKPIQDNIDIVVKLINSGCLIQIDAGSLIGHFGKKCKNTSEILLKRNMVHFIGSDAHNDLKRNFCLKDAMLLCENIMGRKSEKLVKENPLKLIKGEKILPFEIQESNAKNLFQKILNRMI
ncbi:MAG: capsular biosynthesis protein [Candidatus Marinimicrobia bacterium]|nr:capsular biosynthesis protein [Candidatus Neomarinimicrobiota bacterium]